MGSGGSAEQRAHEVGRTVICSCSVASVAAVLLRDVAIALHHVRGAACSCYVVRCLWSLYTLKIDATLAVILPNYSYLRRTRVPGSRVAGLRKRALDRYRARLTAGGPGVKHLTRRMVPCGAHTAARSTSGHADRPHSVSPAAPSASSRRARRGLTATISSISGPPYGRRAGC